MTQPRHELTTRKVLLQLPGMETVTSRLVEFAGADGQPLPLQVYYPAGVAPPVPAVVIVEGYADPGFTKFFGCRFMEMDWSVSMARLMAASGLAVITYANREPEADAKALLAHVIADADVLGVDATRTGLWATSGHGPLAVSLLGQVRCAVLSNTYTCDVDGATEVADAARTFRFAAPAPGELPGRTPLFVIRSGQDEMPGLNTSLDRFVSRALASNVPLTLVNHPEAPHSFDLFHDSELTRHVLRQALAFLHFHLA